MSVTSGANTMAADHCETLKAGGRLDLTGQDREERMWLERRLTGSISPSASKAVSEGGSYPVSPRLVGLTTLSLPGVSHCRASSSPAEHVHGLNNMI